MRLTLVAVATIAPMTLAAPLPIGGSSGTADIVARQNAGSVAGDRHSDTRLLVPLGHIFNVHSSLEVASTLILNAAYGTDVASINCTPFKNADGTGDSGASFSKDHPLSISVNSIQIRSILCK